MNDLYARLFHKKHISNHDHLYRRIHPDWQKGPMEISSAAFIDPELSVDLASLTTPEKAWKRSGNTEWGLARVSVAAVLDLPVAQEVKHWPTISNWAHTLVIGKKNSKKVRQKIKPHLQLLIQTGEYRPAADPSEASHT